MSATGQSRQFDDTGVTSGLPPVADIFSVRRHVSKVPIAVVDLGFRPRPNLSHREFCLIDFLISSVEFH